MICYRVCIFSHSYHFQTVLVLKKKLEETSGIAVSQQRIFSMGRELQDDGALLQDTPLSTGVPDQPIPMVQVAVRPRAGGAEFT